MTRTLINIIAAATAIFYAATAFAAPKITASIDSAVIEMGSRATMRVDITGVDGQCTAVDFPQKGAQFGPVDIIDIKADTTGTHSIGYNILIQAFDPGLVTIPPIRYVYGAGDTASSDIITLKVLPVDLDTLTTINPMATIVNPATRWYDYIPDWWYWVVIAIAVIGCALALYLVYRRNGSIIIHHKRVVPPYELAIARLGELKSKRLAETGHEKEYYTELTDILRQYLEGRFAINALEMSSTQIIHALRHNDSTRVTADNMKQILEIADFVKFAKVRPLPDDNIKTFNTAMQFVETTKPEPEPEPDDQTKTTTKTKTDKTDK